MLGRIKRSTGKWYKVILEDGKMIDARIKGKMRLQGLDTTNPVAVGDYVSLQEEKTDWMIVDVKPREKYIARQSPAKKTHRHILAANVDQAFLLVTMSKPRTSSGFIDRFLMTAEAYDIPTTLVFNKQDILSEKDSIKQNVLAEIYENIGYQTAFVSAIENVGISELKEQMQDKTTLLCGHSGVGKSTFANAIDKSLELKTKAISDKYSKGVHTTTFAELFLLPFGGSVIDIPGIKEFGVTNFEKAEVGHYFVEMAAKINECKFNNCLHINEPSCAIKKSLDIDIHPERYLNYLNILDDIDEQKEY